MKSEKKSFYFNKFNPFVKKCLTTKNEAIENSSNFIVSLEI